VGCCKTPKYTFSATLVEFVVADWQKSGLNYKNNPKSVVFAPLDPLAKTMSTLLIIIAKVRSLPTFLM